MTKAGIMINHLEFIINAKHLLNSEHNLGGHFSMKDHDLCTVINRLVEKQLVSQG